MSMNVLMRTVPYYTHEVPLTKIGTKREFTLHIDECVDEDSDVNECVDEGSDEDSPLLPMGSH